MNFIETDFSKELSILLNKHKITLESDKLGIYLVQGLNDIQILLSEAEFGSEDPKTRMYIRNYNFRTL